MPKKVEIEVQGMTCDTCKIHVEKSFGKIEGVSKVTVPTWKDAKAIVEIEEDKVPNGDRFKDSLKGSQYKTGIIKELSATPPAETGSSTVSVDTDIAVIGTGGSGMAAAIEAASMGKKVYLIEKGTLGGTCVNVGCIPSKAFIKTANYYWNALHSKFSGIGFESTEMDWEKLVLEREQLVQKLRSEKYESVLARFPEITVKNGAAHFEKDKDGNPVLSLKSGETLRAKKYVIATGSRPNFPDIPGIRDMDVLDSATALFLKKKPESLIIIGGGFIALELGQAFFRLGVKIESIEVRSRLLSTWDQSVSDEITAVFKREGINVNTGSTPLRFFQKDGKKGVEVKDKNGGVRKLLADQLLVALGRQANVEDLNLDAVDVKLNARNKNIAVNGFMQTSNPRIYAAGDVAELPKLVYVAARSGKIAARHAFDSSVTTGLDVIPEVIFTDPQIARVGLSEEEASEKGLTSRISVLPMADVPKSFVTRNSQGFIKLIADANRNTLIGAQIVSENAGELIQTAAIAISMGTKYGYTIDNFKDQLFPYLTEVEGLRLATQTFTTEVAALSCCAG